MALTWDHASLHKNKRLKQWIRSYNQQAKREGNVRLLTLLLPKKSPWLNPIEPCWIHAKRKVCQSDGELSADELRRRLCAHFHTDVQTAALKLSDFVLHQHLAGFPPVLQTHYGTHPVKGQFFLLWQVAHFLSGAPIRLIPWWADWTSIATRLQ